MSVKLIAFDLDGTFLDDKKNILPENIAALEKAAEKGVHIVPATGRIYKGIPEALRELPFMRWYITANGSYIYDAVEDRAAARAEIPAEQAVAFYEYADTLGVLYDCYQDNWGYMTEEMQRRAPEFVQDRGILDLVLRLRTPVPELRAYLREKGEPLQKLQLYFTDQALRRRLLRELPERWPALAFTTSLPVNIEINSAAANKGHALECLCAMLGIDPAETLAFGDGSNDISMLRAAGCGVATANAFEEVKAAADRVTGTNNEAGVAAVLGEYFRF